MTARAIPRSSLFVLLFALLTVASPVWAQTSAPVAGVVVDEAGAVVAGARITATRAGGGPILSTTSDAAGAFVLQNLGSGTYTVLVEMNLFSSASQTVTVASGRDHPAIRVTLKAGGFAEHVVVTAKRTESRLAETPQKIEVIDARDIERSVATDVTDVLKKNSGVDVIQYTGALSGIGVRGFRPQFSGVNKRSLLLIDGRPSGVTNLATLLVEDIARIEVLKGAASAVYGSSAMGGVVNVLTRESHGKLTGDFRVGAGSFGTIEVAGRTGGSLTPKVDFDVSGSTFDQRDDIRMGNGIVRPATSFKTYAGSGRVGVDLPAAWRVEARTDVYRGRDINSPPDLAAGIVGQSRKNIERSSADGRVMGLAGGHAMSVSAYRTSEASHTSNVTTSNVLDLPYLPYLSFESELTWTGAQLRDTWGWRPGNTLVVGLDVEKVSSVSRTFTRTGAPSAPFSANYNKRTAGFYGENTLRLRQGRTVVTAGGRVDRITAETLATPLRTNFTPSETTFLVFNPSIGVKHEIIDGLRAHATAGRAFIPAEASMLTGFTTTTVGGRTQISQGNPDLKPERSTSFDIGAEWSRPSTRVDVTGFRTVVKDRFISNIIVSNPPPPDPIILSVTNGLDAHISGLDVDVEQRLNRSLGVFASATHYFSRKERLASGAEQDILNVALNTVRAGVDIDVRRLSARISGRFARGRRDNDFSQPGFPIVDYDNLSVFDASATYRLAPKHAIGFSLNNIFDAYYYEKIGYPLQGVSFKATYRFGF
jgi:vitamin B12 transporter